MNKIVSILVAIALLLICQTNSKETIEEKEITSPRKLGFDFDVDKTFTIKTFSIAGQKLVFKYRVAVKNGKAINQIRIESGLGSYTFGNAGIDTEYSKTWSRTINLVDFRFPPYPNVIVGLYGTGNLEFSVKYASASKDKLLLAMKGELKASFKVLSAQGPTTKMFAGGDGTVIIGSGVATVTKRNIISKDFKFSGTAVNSWVEASINDEPIWRKSYQIIRAWR